MLSFLPATATGQVVSNAARIWQQARCARAFQSSDLAAIDQW
jgi:hypothetical protein